MRSRGGVTPTMNNNHLTDYFPSVTFQDMDIYYYKQLAVNLQNHDLHKKIEHEMKMRDGSLKLLAAAKHRHQQLEAAKSLHTSNCRMLAYMEKLQQLSDNSTHAIRSSAGNQFPCAATISLSDIRIPLMWKDSDHFKNKGNYRRFSVFCLARCGTEVHETSLISHVDRLMTDITFDDVLILKNIGHKFECVLDVYAYEHCEDLTIASAQVKLRKKINNISNTVGRRLSGLSLKDSVEANSLKGPKFELVASTRLTLTNAEDKNSSFDLTATPNAEIVSLPLFGSFCCRFVVQPECLVKETTSSYLYIKEKDQWVRYWCSLQNLKISCWLSQLESDLADPLSMIPVTKESIIIDTEPSQAERPHSFQIENRAHNNSVWYISAESSADLEKWWQGLQQHLLDQVVWKHTCTNVMEIEKQKPPTLGSPYLIREKRAGSLYDRIRTRRTSVRQHHHLVDMREGSPLTSTFNRLAKDAKEDRSPLSRNNSYPK